jgi:O-antigen/teichoic acid export membrane protein
LAQSAHNFDFSNKKLVKNTFYNLLGYTVPMLFALIFIPPLISGLGKERFGLLSLSWIMIGYFSFFDFGIGKSVTKVISEKIGDKNNDQIPAIFWNSLTFLFWISILVMLVGLLIVPSLLSDYINISELNYKEALSTFYLIVLSVPLVTTTTSVRGFLEAYQKFSVVNFYRIILGISTFVLPYIVSLIVDSLFWIVFSLLLIRLMVWIFYLFAALKTNKELLENFSPLFKIEILKPVFRISIWITIVNVVGPIILYSDRFLISSLLSLTAVTFYSTPYEMITKLLIIPTAFVGVLFPAFSASYVSAPNLSKDLFKKSAKFIFIFIYPIVLLITIFSFDGLSMWLDQDFARESVLVLQFLSVGILFSSLSSIPNNFFQGIGKPNIPATLNLIELPIYVFLMYVFIKIYGINGAAFFWMIAAGIDAIINYLIAYYKFGIVLEKNLLLILFASILIVLSVPFLLSILWIKIILSVILIALFILISWKLVLIDEEKRFLLERISSIWVKK